MSEDDTGEDADALAYRRWVSQARLREEEGRLSGWICAAHHVGQEAAAAFLANDDGKARALRDLATRILAKGEQECAPLIKERLGEAVEAEQAHIAALEAQEVDDE